MEFEQVQDRLADEELAQKGSDGAKDTRSTKETRNMMIPVDDDKICPRRDCVMLEE